MKVPLDFNQDLSDPNSDYFRLQAAMGWQIRTTDPPTLRQFLTRVRRAPDPDGKRFRYLDLNSEALGWLVEAVTNEPLRLHIANLVDAAGLEGALHLSCDRMGVPSLSSGACLSGRDAARFFLLIARGGDGVNGRTAGSAGFLDRTRRASDAATINEGCCRYSNHFVVHRDLLMHTGWGGHVAWADPETGVAGVLLSVLTDPQVDESQHLHVLRHDVAEISKSPLVRRTTPG